MKEKINWYPLPETHIISVQGKGYDMRINVEKVWNIEHGNNADKGEDCVRNNTNYSLVIQTLAIRKCTISGVISQSTTNTFRILTDLESIFRNLAKL